MNVKQRLKLLAILSVAAIISLTMANIYKEYLYTAKLKTVEDLVSFSKKISTMMDQIQNERSISAVYIQSKGELLVDELDAQRKRTDAEAASFRTLVTTYQASDPESPINADINQIQKSLKELSNIRSKIDRHKLSFEEMIAYYENINNPILHIIAINAETSPAGNISKDLSAYYFFLKAKEIASKQKAILTSAFVSEDFTGEVFDETIALIAKEQSYLDVFENLAPIELTNIYKTEETIQVFEDSYSFSQDAMKNAKEGNFEVDMEMWFGMIAKKSEIFQAIDQKAIDKIAQDIKQTPSLALYSAIAGIVFLLMILFVIYGINKEISKRIHSFDWIIEQE